MADITIAFIGCGAMGGALARAMARARSFKADVVVTARHKEKAQAFAKNNDCRAAESNAEAVKEADIVFIAVKPNDVQSVIFDIAYEIKSGALIVSVAAGITLSDIGHWTASPAARIMPNVGAAVGQSMTAVCYASNVSEEQKKRLEEVLRAAGVVREVDEALMPCVTAVSGSGSAYVFMFIEAMADAAVRGGMKRADAYTFAKQTVLGAAMLAMKDDRGMSCLKDSVCSPAGTTIEGVAALEERGFRGTIMAAIKAGIRG